MHIILLRPGSAYCNLLTLQNLVRNPRASFVSAHGLMIQQQGRSGLLAITVMFGCTTNVQASRGSRGNSFASHANCIYKVVSLHTIDDHRDANKKSSYNIM